jgi:hypothetical protein
MLSTVPYLQLAKTCREKSVVQVASVRRRSWAGLAWLIVIATGALIALALGNTIVLLATLLVGLALRALAPASPIARSASSGAAGSPRAQRAVQAADGTIRQALLVPAEAVEGYQTVLTIDGYVLVNAEGQVVHALSRAAPAEASEPVVVTVVDG